MTPQDKLSATLRLLANSTGDNESALAKKAWAIYDANPGVWPITDEQRQIIQSKKTKLKV